MSKLPEISSLLAALASNLERTAGEEDRNLDDAIRKLNLSFNLSETNPRAQVLDTALSLMCITAPQVFDSMIEFTVRTIVTVLSSSAEVQVVEWDNKESLQVSGSSFGLDCFGTFEAFADILPKLEAFRGDLSPSLLYAVVRSAAFAPNCHHSEKITEMKPRGGRNSAFAKVLRHSPRDCNLKSGEIPLRLLWWLLDPMLLKNDICQILQETTSRPFLCLEKEFYEKTDWHSILICLVLSPTMFMQTRALLHNWFLLTGLASFLELHSEIVLRVLDVGCRPMWWGVPMEIALTLPFSHAYFPCESRLLRILSGPLSWKKFSHLVCEVIKPNCAANQLNFTSNQAAKASRVDHNSCWAMTINFPSWFSFASLLLFLDGSSMDRCYLKCVPWLNNSDQPCDAELPYSSVAARFIAWVLNPIGDSCQDLLLECLTGLLHVKTLKLCGFGRGIAATGRNTKEIWRSLSDKKGNINFSNFDSQTLLLWLKEVDDIHIRYSRKVNEHYESADHSQGIGCQKNSLYRKMPLGILLCYSDSIGEAESELLLHYAATGTFHNLFKPQVEQKRMKHSLEFALTDKYTRKEAVSGANIAFNLTDTIESMSALMFETEEDGLKFLSQVKGKIVKYLLNCVKRLLQLRVVDDYMHLSDLYLRMVRWKHQGQDICSRFKDWDDAIDAVKCASSPQF
ncbi:unnamed protein product [Cuscuta campestris]|uniref:Uncharacterized protein n=1 Tax=Cuscuta campestris TaxID=132261 RepID=A0A484LE84_9ASTE|nr:unnamed protein product [Cuscuta campestris]